MKRFVLRLILPLILFLMGWFAAPEAQAQTCSLGAPTIALPAFSPISGTALTTTGTVKVTCTWGAINLVPNVKICVTFTGASPRTLVNGSNAISYNMYTDSGYATPWGSTAATALSTTFSNSILGGTDSRNLDIYTQIAANQTTVPSTNNGDTVYSATYAGSAVVLSYQFYLLVAPACGTSGFSTGTTNGFTVNVTVINKCTINATGLTFGPSTTLRNTLTAQGALSVQCTNNDAYKILLSSGVSGQVGARTLKGQTHGATIPYQLYTDSSYATAWGDGTGGTSTYLGTGTGLAVPIPIYGRILPQPSTPAPDTYQDSITATIQF
ncbi:secreted pili protein involved in motility and biofilm formation [Pandoraea aquatica]|uniref:Secreted pili protein involved in motility and biofilm formation n=1 Tax=Pandoraea aquatica TaxID=2508290 RepID=A0A5E4XGH7_9BURK|nr:spore coat U domain-containing protein [Pandoraea aquatica]VVE35376.1 secreted pili protein involved in motility and biofilm formation [Pandoraea aquatica]